LPDCKYKIAEKGKPGSAWLTIEIIKIVDNTAYMQGSYPRYQPVPVTHFGDMLLLEQKDPVMNDTSSNFFRFFL
jgi:hypothetical protein